MMTEHSLNFVGLQIIVRPTNSHEKSHKYQFCSLTDISNSIIGTKLSIDTDLLELPRISHAECS